MSPDEARAFVASNHRAVLITRRPGGRLQTSPVLVGVDDEGKVVISTREGAYKMTTAAPCSTSSACWFASRSTRRAPPTPLAGPAPVLLGSTGGGFTLWLGVRAASCRQVAEMAC
jgi:hypothetical protein